MRNSFDYLQVDPGLAEIARVAERTETDSRVAAGCQAFSTVRTRHLAAPVGRALLWNDNKSGDLIKVGRPGREIESRSRESSYRLSLSLSPDLISSARARARATDEANKKPFLFAATTDSSRTNLSERRSINLFRLIVPSTMSLNVLAGY